MCKRLLTIGLLLLAMPAPLIATGPAIRLNYAECVEVALDNNDEIRAASFDVQLSEGKSLEAHPKGIPVIQYEHRIAPVPKDIDNARESFFDGEISVFNNFKLEFGTPITTFGKIKTAQELGNIGIYASEQQRSEKQTEIALNIYKTYQGILLARELMGLANKAFEAIRGKITELEKERFVDEIAILKLKVALYEVERRVQEAREKEALANYAMKLQLGFESDTDFDIKSRSLTPYYYRMQPVEFYLDQSKQHQPKYKLLNAGVEALEKKLKIEKLKPVPNLGVGGFFDIGRAPDTRGGEDESAFTNPFNFTKAGVGLQLKGELDYIKTKSKVQQAKAELMKTIYLRRAAFKGLELDIRKSHLEVEGRRSLMAKASEEKRAARQLVFLTKSNLDIGLGDKKDYLDALQSYLLFQGREYEAIFHYNVAVHTLLSKIGELYPQQRKDEP